MDGSFSSTSFKVEELIARPNPGVKILMLERERSFEALRARRFGRDARANLQLRQQSLPPRVSPSTLLPD
jgi:hypothetical protein